MFIWGIRRHVVIVQGVRTHVTMNVQFSCCDLFHFDGIFSRDNDNAHLSDLWCPRRKFSLDTNEYFCLKKKTDTF